jgi:hypothetical protein
VSEVASGIQTELCAVVRSAIADVLKTADLLPAPRVRHAHVSFLDGTEIT